MNQLQQKMLDIMTVVHQLCVDNGIQYSLDGGTMIGAIREKGFIPWDDDMDICMTMDNYHKFLEVIKDFHHDKVEFLTWENNPDYKYTFVKAVDKTTTILEKPFSQDVRSAVGVWLDIFPMAELKAPERLAKLNKKRMFWVKLKMLQSKAKPSTTKEKLAYPLTKLLSLKHINKKLAKKYVDKGRYDYLYAPDGYFDSGAMAREWFDEYMLVPFEDTQLYVVKDYDKYLTQLYGDYMTRPSEDKQVPTHDSVYMDLHKPYREYIAEQTKQK